MIQQFQNMPENLLALGIGVLEPQLLSHVEKRRSAQSHEEDGRSTRTRQTAAQARAVENFVYVVIAGNV